MRYADYQSQANKAAQLVDAGDFAAALEILERLVASDLPDLDKSVMLVNIATVCEKLQRADLAVSAYDKAIPLERSHKRFFALESKAAYLAQKERTQESLQLYRQLLQRADLTLSERERIQRNVQALEA